MRRYSDTKRETPGYRPTRYTPAGRSCSLVPRPGTQETNNEKAASTQRAQTTTK